MVHPHGSFCFAELLTSEVELGKRFYSHLLGWDAVDVAAAGEYAMFRLHQDQEGAEFGLWEGRGHHGSDVQDQAGSMWWMELMARDVDAARRFYTSLFDWSLLDTLKYTAPQQYTIFKVGDISVGGAMQFEPDWGIWPRWQVYFAIDDFKETVDRAEALGGVPEFAREVPNTGQLCIIRDPVKAVFVVMRPNDVA